MKIEGSVSLVTGANRGLGRAYARELVSRGAAKVYGAAFGPQSMIDVSLLHTWLQQSHIDHDW